MEETMVCFEETDYAASEKECFVLDATWIPTSHTFIACALFNRIQGKKKLE